MDKRPARILVIYSWDCIWSMGPGRGSPDFWLSLRALAESCARVTVVHPAGAGRMAAELPEGVEAVAFRWPERPFMLPAEGPRFLRLAVFCINWLLRISVYARFTLAARRAALRTACREDFSLVAAYGYMAATAGRLVSRRLGAPLVMRLFGVSIGMKGFSPLVRLAQFEEVLSFRAGAERWVITADGSGGMDVALRLGVPCQRVVELLCAVERRRPPGPVDREQYRRSLGQDPRCRVVLRVCRLWAQQRVERLIRSLPAALPDGTPVAAVIIGEGPERRKLEALATRLGKAVVFIGALPNADLPLHYLAADLYLASADRTNLTHSVLEALCYGLPVVALDIGRTRDVVRDGVNGRLVRPEGLGTLEGELIKLLSGRDSLAALAAGALQTARELIPDHAERMRREAVAFGLGDAGMPGGYQGD